MTVAPGRRISIGRIEADVRREVAKLRDQQPVQFHDGPRCRVCREEGSRNLVNQMLANAKGYSEILGMVELTINPLRAKNAKITWRSIQNHAHRHFNVEEPAKAAYRDILERRAAERAVAVRAEGELAVAGVTRLITAYGYLDVMAQKGYETLIKDETVVSPTTGMEAVVKLHELLHRDDDDREAAELRAQLAIIRSAVKDVVPEEFWNEIVSRIEDAEARMSTNVVDVEVVDGEDDDYDDEPFDPHAEMDPDDSLEN